MVIAFDVIGVIDSSLFKLNARFVERADIPAWRLYVLNDFLSDGYGAGGTLLFRGGGAGIVLLLPCDLLLQLSLCPLSLLRYQCGLAFFPTFTVLHDAVDVIGPCD
ncbi:hypothetical protein NPT98_004540 [Salmonella enterica]|nr:hypothetical protein [Salmonella enterica]